jgi:ribulose-phosphate 3-epimerase
MVKIAASVLNADFGCLKDQINAAIHGGADWIHLDIMDGHFVPNLTFGPVVISAVNQISTVPLDTHLMIQNADLYLDRFKQAGADILTVHVETSPHLWSTIDEIHSLGIKAGVTLNPATPIHLLEPVLSKVDLVLVMSVEPGFGGQKFIPQSLERLDYLREQKEKHNYSYYIEVDGGIDSETAKQVVNAGADVLVIGTAIFKSKDIPQAIQTIKNSII